MRKQPLCAICKSAERDWAWQPFGPGVSPLSFTLPGSHYRGFPVVSICSFCKVEKVEMGEAVMFDYKHTPYRYYGDGSTPVALVLWNGGTTTLLPHDETVTMLCRDTPGEHDIIGYISDPRLADEIIKVYNRQVA